MSTNIFTGKVSSVDYDLLSFEINGINKTFYAANWVAVHKKFIFPDEQVLIESSNNIPSFDFVLCDKDRFEFEEEIIQDYHLTDLIIKYNLDDTFMRKIYQLYSNLKDYFDRFQINFTKIILGILNELLKENRRDFYIKPISTCKIVDDHMANYQKFPYWTYVFNNKPYNKHYILGYITINENYGIPMLCDSRWAIPIVIFKNKDIKKYINRFVLINKAVIFSEIYNNREANPISCLAFNLDYVILLETVPTLFKEKINVIDEYESRNKNVEIQLLHIGPICFGENEEECWIEAFNKNLGKIFIILGKSLIKIKPLLSINYQYNILYDELRSKIKWYEMERYYKYRSYKFDKPNTKFLLTTNSNTEQTLKTAEEAKLHLKLSEEIINITGLIVQKRFVEFSVSYHGGSKRYYPFGTPGSQTHVIHLKLKNDDLAIFLNDFNRYIYPFGLIPGMVVNVYRVKPQSQKYFMCTPLTTFELVEFQKSPLISSANINNRCKDDNTFEKIVFPGMSNILPFNTVYLARLKFITVTQGSISYDIIDKKIDINIKLSCLDEFGNFDLILTSEKVFKNLLNLGALSFDLFLKGMEKLEHYKYYPFVDKQHCPSNSLGRFEYVLNLVLHRWTFCIFDVLVYVRKTKCGSYPVYSSVDI